MIGYGDMFIYNVTKPTQGTFITKLWKAKKEVQFVKQERAYAIINNRLSYNNCKAIKNLITVIKIIAKVGVRF